MALNNSQQSTTKFAFVALHRAIVALPDPSSSGAYGERVVFFEVPSGVHAGAHLEKVLALVWRVDTTDWCADGAIYNVKSAHELEAACGTGKADSESLHLFEIGWGGSSGIGPGHIHYARATDIDCLVSPRLATRLQRGLWIIENLYADHDATEILANFREK